MATRITVARANAAVDSHTAALDAGAGAATVKIYTGTQPATADTAASGTLLATITCSDPSFGAAASKTATANAIAAVAASATGTAGWFRAASSTPTTVLDGSVSATGGGGQMELNTTSLQSGVDVDITTWSITQPDGS